MTADGKGRMPVHLHVSYWRFDEYRELLKESGLGLELFTGTYRIDEITEKGLSDIAGSVGRPGAVSMHAPFMDLSPGAVDPLVGEATLRRFMQAMSFAGILKPKVVVFHSGYDRWRYADNVELWLKKSIPTWRRVLEEAERQGVRIALENVTDTVPDHLVRLVREVGHELFGLCLDVGHREVFSELSVVEWLDAVHPYLFEIHLHDNDGSFDEHLPVGSGRVDFESLFGSLASLGVKPVCTLEPHNVKDARTSMERLSGYAGLEWVGADAAGREGPQ